MSDQNDLVTGKGLYLTSTDKNDVRNFSMSTKCLTFDEMGLARIAEFSRDPSGMFLT
jgi:hypothetical protein